MKYKVSVTFLDSCTDREFERTFFINDDSTAHLNFLFFNKYHSVDYIRGLGYDPDDVYVVKVESTVEKYNE